MGIFPFFGYELAKQFEITDDQGSNVQHDTTCTDYQITGSRYACTKVWHHASVHADVGDLRGAIERTPDCKPN